MKRTFNVIILNGRPASGKSEIIDFLKKTPLEERIARFHIGDFVEIDDFPMLWTWFEEDAILERTFHEPRLHTDREGYFLYPHLWHLLIERLCLEYSKRLKDDPGFHEKGTALIEFSRGKEHGGYRQAYSHLSKEILEKGVILYVRVPFEESLRRNRRRFNPDKPHSILEHGLPDDKLKRLYSDDDFDELFSGPSTETIDIKGFSVPFGIFQNDPEITDRPELLASHLEEVSGLLWERWSRL